MEPPSRRNAVGHIGKFVWSIDLDKVFKDCGLDQVRVKLSYTIDLVASNGGEVGHLHHFRLGFFDDRNAPEHVAIVGELLLHHMKELRIDLVNDLEMSREQVLHHRDRPFLQRFWHYGVVCVAEGILDDGPGFRPVKTL